MLKDKILNRETGLLFYGITPPKINTEPSKLEGIASRQMSRLEGKDLDGLILYDIQDESSRTDEERPFPFMRTLSPQLYSDEYLGNLKIPKVVYKSVGNYSVESMGDWLKGSKFQDTYTVFVGSPSKQQEVSLTLGEAYALTKDINAEVVLGGVTIPERHARKNDEHLRILNKIDSGCSFFVSQCVYNIEQSKNFLADYYFYCLDNGLEPVPIIFTLTPCGSVKTLQFMQWLGIDIPNWIYKELKYSDDILHKSIEECEAIADELWKYASEKNIPIGFNIESVAVRKSEIEASIELLDYVSNLMKK